MTDVSSEYVKIKEVNNLLCGKSGCTRLAKKTIIFQIGFSAGFCDQCGDELIGGGLGLEEVVEK